MRIVSTVPSQTELLHDLGLENQVVGITKFCIHPEDFYNKTIKIGGTKNLNLNKIIDLKPDWIISNKEENVQEQIESLHNFCQHYTSDVHDLDSALKMITDIGQITDTELRAQEITDKIITHFHKITTIQPQRKALYLIWKDPYMSIGRDTFIHDMLQKCGWMNVCNEHLRYPEITIEDIRRLAPDDILLSSEPYPFKEKHVEEFKKLFPDSRPILVDGTYFSWYGSRLMDSPKYFNNLIADLLKP